MYKRIMFLFDGIFPNIKLCILYKIESHISIANITGMKAFENTDSW